MNYLVYKITNKLSGKIYIGVHKTDDINDDYMGSGKTLIPDQELFGIENFEKEILVIFDNPDDMYKMESLLVNKDFVEDANTYNMCLGGFGGWDEFKQKKAKQTVMERYGVSHIMHIEEIKNKVKETNMKKYGVSNVFMSDKVKQKIATTNMKKYGVSNPFSSKEIMKKRNDTCLEKYGHENPGFLGKTHTEETKKKMRDSKKNQGIGKTNSQFGTCWIHNLELKVSKKIKKEELESFIELGWIKGRKQKFGC